MRQSRGERARVCFVYMTLEKTELLPYDYDWTTEVHVHSLVGLRLELKKLGLEMGELSLATGIQYGGPYFEKDVFVVASLPIMPL